jgi:hypothetical protein
MTITTDYIRNYFSDVVEEAFEIFGFDGDDSYVLRNCSLNIKKMRPLGTAHQITGEVCVSDSFIGTNLYDRLHNTIRHEIAHIVTPIHELSHGAVWKRNAKLLRAEPKATCPMPKEWHEKKPIQVYALLSNGEKVFVRAMHRKSKRFASGTECRYSIRGLQVKKWIVKENK